MRLDQRFRNTEVYAIIEVDTYVIHPLVGMTPQNTLLKVKICGTLLRSWKKMALGHVFRVLWFFVRKGPKRLDLSSTRFT